MDRDIAIYLRLARKAGSKPERDYYVECAKSLLRRMGIDTSGIHEDPNIAMVEIEEGVVGKGTAANPYGRYGYLFERIDSL
jgi:hypothetical protein